jgi:iron complex outermembrane receptor protein
MKALRRKKLPSALVVALGAGVALSVVTSASAQQAQRVEKIEVTGTQIKRVDTETVAPVEIITREQIERTGQPTVADVLRNIPANTGGSFGESFSNSFASGAAGISLRGLGQKTTLVLINGRRTAGYGFAQNLQDSFVDLNSIPTAAVERIEILKDGASAIYGSDAIAGVVNVILRKDYKGVEFSGSAGEFNDKNEYRAALTFGFGDLARDRWSVFATLDYYKRDELRFNETDLMPTRDFRHLAGGRNLQNLTSGGTWRQLTATGGLTNNFQSIPREECEGVGGIFMTGPEAIQRGLTTSAAIGAPTNTFCAYDLAKDLTALPGQERFGFLSRATREFSPNMTGYVELGLSRVENFQVFTRPFFNTIALEQTAAGLRPFAYTADFAPGAAGNPFSTNARFLGSNQDFPTRDQETISDSVRILAGLQYTLRNWDLDSAIGWSRNEIEQDNLNRFSLSGTSAVLGIPATRQPPVPVVTSTQLNLNRPSQTPEAIRNAMMIDVKRDATSELKFADTKASTELWQMPGGPVGLAIGGEIRNEKLSDRPDPRAQLGEVLGQGITATDGKRDHYAVYAEMSLPVTRQIEAQVAGRHDHYSDYGTSNTPKVGLKFKPTNSILVRGNWGKGFRAPSLPEISPSVATFFVAVNDPVLGTTATQISGIFAGNPDLEPEKSESATLGVIFEPTTNFSVGLNFYRIEYKNLVTSQSFQGLIDDCFDNPASVACASIVRDPVTGAIVTIFNNYINVGEIITKGVDLEARYRFNTPYGRITPRLNMSYVDSWKQDGTEYAGTNGQGTSTIPRVRGQLAVDWDYRALSVTGQVNYTRHYEQQFLPSSWFTPQDPRFQNQTYPPNVPSYTTYDIFAKYQLTKNLSINGAILNINQAIPPFDPGFGSTFAYDFSLHDPRGRRVRVGFTYRM